MPELDELVEAELRAQNTSENIIQLWKDIFRWYKEGGPTVIEENLEKKIKEITSKFAKGIKEIETESRLKKTKHVTRKRRKR